MALILTLDTALTLATVSLSRNAEVLGAESNASQYDHASFVQPAIKKVLEKSSASLSSIDAVAVVNGPGSYTGLRVGLASAKGICYALNKPLILINTLHLLAFASVGNHSKSNEPEAISGNRQPATGNLLCPMIDARRMEVFTALYDSSLQEIKKASAEILDENFLHDELEKQTIIFSGNGSEKFQQICHHPNAVFSEESYSVKDVAALAYQSYLKNDFADIAYCEPFYVKGFYTKKAI